MEYVFIHLGWNKLDLSSFYSKFEKNYTEDGKEIYTFLCFVDYHDNEVDFESIKNLLTIIK